MKTRSLGEEVIRESSLLKKTQGSKIGGREMIYVIFYVLLSMTIGIISHAMERYLIKINEILPSSYSGKGPLCGKWYLRYVLFGIFELRELFMYSMWLLKVVARRRKSRHICAAIESMGLEKYDPIIITYIDGDSVYAGFNYLNKENAELKWFLPGTQLSGGGWDMYTHLTIIAKVERTILHPGTMW